MSVSHFFVLAPLSFAISCSFSLHFQGNVESALCVIEDRLPMRGPIINSAFGLQLSTIKSTQLKKTHLFIFQFPQGLGIYP